MPDWLASSLATRLLAAVASDIESDFCSGFASCNCGSRADEIVVVTDCAFSENPTFPDGCSVTCGSGSGAGDVKVTVALFMASVAGLFFVV